ncbi:hypothetical protein H1P_640016 [Hyella patelloides LEGE 07179]|uniref:Uncharacterized protein n=1 Tax=Hyella patelloides LEGE 07179 TaxID=945734 RepID=A0A563W217_9CYAN|nr:hypothetical protein [Hyella patelloides]VEP17749.1 hypothetical protein H1P_640016 [Hyella patelloides LEGE 07179]
MENKLPITEKQAHKLKLKLHQRILSSVPLLANLLVEAKKIGNYSPAKFEPLEDVTPAFLQNSDRLFANTNRNLIEPIQSFVNIT